MFLQSEIADVLFLLVKIILVGIILGFTQSNKEDGFLVFLYDSDLMSQKFLTNAVCIRKC